MRPGHSRGSGEKADLVKRRIFTILSAGSLVLCVGVVTLWVVSYWHVVAIHYAFPTNSPGIARMYVLFGSSGAMGAGWFEGTRDWIDRDGWAFSSMPRDASDEPWTLGLWFKHEPGNGAPGLRDDGVYVPLWFLTIFFLLFPALRLKCFRSERRNQREGLCIQCGYDLRAHGPGQLCPECGTPVPEDLPRKPCDDRIGAPAAPADVERAERLRTGRQ